MAAAGHFSQRCRGALKPLLWAPQRLAALGLLSLLQACTHLAVEDCGSGVLGRNEPRLRSSHLRLLLADLPAASARFAPYAAMSALAYAEDADCGNTKPKLSADERARLEAVLAAAGWKETRDADGAPPCEDAQGLFFRVWTLQQAQTTQATQATQVVMAFRGTWGWKDWVFGNLHGITRFLPMRDQYANARAAAQKVFARYPGTPQAPTQFFSTGHSLGGGLAQHVLYSHPDKLIQAIAFDPSSVTGFVEQAPQRQVSACECSAQTLVGEPRIFRVYDAYEILANLRIVHKIFFPPHRHIQELRFPNAASHSMTGLALYLIQHAGSDSSAQSRPWYAAKGPYSATESCTAAFVRTQQASCQKRVSAEQWNRCPQ